MKKLWLIGVATVAAAAAVPAHAGGTDYAFVQAYSATPQIAYGTQLAYTLAQKDNAPVAASYTGSGGYSVAYSSPVAGGTVSASAFSLADFYEATGSYNYTLSFIAPATATAKVRIAFSGTLSSWGSGQASAYATAYSYYDYGYQVFEFVSDETTKARNRAFKGALTLTLSGGDFVPIALGAAARVDRDATFGTGTPGGASAYLDPVVTFGNAVPEPASWALMVAGFGVVGTAARRRRVAVAA